uniref:Gamma interferon inducible lysosomal thiol reductase n=1 Tax=Rhabditophanes sp. KR3021 TaxID=114890 RepID=A0AC35TFM9_9BILA
MLVVVVGAILIGCISGFENDLNGTINKIHLTVYAETQCSDTTHFFRKHLLPTHKTLGNHIMLKVIPFGKASCTYDEDDFKCSCQHGKNECDLNILQNCILYQITDPIQYLPLIYCIQGKRNYEVAVRECLDEIEEQVADGIIACGKGKKGRRLLYIAGKKTASLSPLLNFVPWVTINHQRQSSFTYSLEKEICKQLNITAEPCSKYIA